MINRSIVVLRITQSALDALCAHGEQAYPHECCGVLLGYSDAGARVTSCAVRCENARQDSPATRYAIDPHEVVKVQRAARERGLEVVGFYHSHPDHPAHWSPTDLAEAYWIGCSYVITAVERGRATVTNSFLLTGSEEEKRFEAEEIEEIDSSTA